MNDEMYSFRGRDGSTDPKRGHEACDTDLDDDAGNRMGRGHAVLINFAHTPLYFYIFSFDTRAMIMSCFLFFLSSPLAISVICRTGRDSVRRSGHAPCFPSTP